MCSSDLPATASYSVTISGSATDLSYSWFSPVVPSGGVVTWSATNLATVSATFTGAGTYQIACRVTSVAATDATIDRAVTFTLATDLVNAVAHGLIANDAVTFAAVSGALPTGLQEQTTYWVRSGGLTADAFTVAASPGGAAIDLSGSSTGSYRVTRLGKVDLHTVTIT